MGAFRLSFNSLRMQLWLWIALPATISLLAVSLIEIYGHEQAMRRLVNERAQGQVQAVAALMDSRIRRAQEELLRLAHAVAPEGAAPANDFFPAGMALYTGDGQLVEVAQRYPWQVVPQIPALVGQVAREQRAGSRTLLDENGQQPLLLLAAPAHNQAVLVGALPAGALALADLPASVRLNSSANLYVTGSDGRSVVTLIQGKAEEYPLSDRMVEARATVVETGWQVVLHEPWAELLSPVLRLENTVWVVVAMAIAVSVLSAYFGLRYIVRPLRRLDWAAGQAGWGRPDALQQSVGGVAEIEDLRLALARMTAQVRRYQQELQGYIDAITLGQEEERKRLARELHDETVQSLIALNQQVELAEKELGRDPHQASARLQALRPLLVDAIAGLRRQIHALRPLYLEDLGFVPALEMLVRQVTQPHNLVGDFEVAGEPTRCLPQALEISAFRIVQEALHNVVAHARAHWVHVELSYRADSITLRIEDDGVGFDAPAHPFQLAQDGHYGLLGMYERAQMHGGRLHIESERGKGTTMVVWLPILAEGAVV
jgi:signal transduction histidine kinase